MKTKFLVFAVIGAAIALALTSEKGEAWREDLMDDAKKWKKKLNKLAGDTSDQLADLKDVLGKEIAGLGSDARDRILAILDESTGTAKSVKAKVTRELS